jgi:hypothetical protein
MSNPVDPAYQAEVLALLDTGSERSFIDEEIARKMQLESSKDVTLKLRTFHNSAPQKMTLPVYEVFLLLADESQLNINVLGIPNLLGEIETVNDGEMSRETPGLLLGADYVWDLLPLKKKPMRKHFQQISSHLGPITIGKSNNTEVTSAFSMISTILDEGETSKPEAKQKLETATITELSEEVDQGIRTAEVLMPKGKKLIRAINSVYPLEVEDDPSIEEKLTLTKESTLTEELTLTEKFTLTEELTLTEESKNPIDEKDSPKPARRKRKTESPIVLRRSPRLAQKAALTLDLVMCLLCILTMTAVQISFYWNMPHTYLTLSRESMPCLTNNSEKPIEAMAIDVFQPNFVKHRIDAWLCRVEKKNLHEDEIRREIPGLVIGSDYFWNFLPLHKKTIGLHPYQIYSMIGPMLIARIRHEDIILHSSKTIDSDRSDAEDRNDASRSPKQKPRRKKRKRLKQLSESMSNRSSKNLP